MARIHSIIPKDESEDCFSNMPKKCAIFWNSNFKHGSTIGDHSVIFISDNNSHMTFSGLSWLISNYNLPKELLEEIKLHSPESLEGI